MVLVTVVVIASVAIVSVSSAAAGQGLLFVGVEAEGGFFLLLVFGGDEFHTAFGAFAGFIGFDFGVHGAGPDFDVFTD